MLKLWFPVEGGATISLVAHYPDTYPYTRFEVKAYELNLAHHQSLFDKNLCLMGRATENWDTDNTLYGVLKEKLQDVLKTGQSENLEEVSTLEENQAEPISDYYPYLPDTIVLIDSAWSIDPNKTNGELIVGVEKEGTVILRGAVLDVKDNSNQSLIESNSVFKKIYPNQLSCRWVRLDELIREDNPEKFFESLCQKFPSLRKPRLKNVRRGSIDIIGIIFPE